MDLWSVQDNPPPEIKLCIIRHFPPIRNYLFLVFSLKNALKIMKNVENFFFLVGITKYY